MKKKSGALGCFALILVALLVIVAKSCFFTVSEKEQVIITRFGEVRDKPIVEAGLHFKMPIVDKLNVFPKQALEWDGAPSEVSTRDKTYIFVDTYARWKIIDPIIYFKRLRTEPLAIKRLDADLNSATKSTIAENDLVEVIRSDKDRVPDVDDAVAEADESGTIGKLAKIRRGRSELEKEILEISKAKLADYGIELLDIRFKRINYNPVVRAQIYQRMVSERQQISNKFISEGDGEAAKILGDKARDLLEIESAAYRQVETIKGEADAKATEIYAKAYAITDEAAQFYEFVRTMSLYEQMLAGQSTIVMSTDSDMFKYLKSVQPDQATRCTQKAASR